MSKRRLSTEQMTSISNVWLTELREKLEKIPQTASLLPDVGVVYQSLVIARDSPAPASEQLRALLLQMTGLDLSHDRNMRIGFRMLQTQQLIAELLDRDAEAAELSQLEKLLYPHGLTGTALKYEEQEGAALLLERQLEDGFKKRLASINTTTEKGEVFPLLSFVEKHIADAKALGIAERQKKKLQEQEQASSAPNAVDERKARQSWIEVASALESNLSLAVRRGTTTKEIAAEILKGLQEAEDKADQEYAKRRAKGSEEKTKTTPEASQK